MHATQRSTESAKRIESTSAFPRFCFNLGRIQPARLPEDLAHAGIEVRDGHIHSPRLMQRPRLSQESGAVCVSLVHYNTIEEIHRFANVLLDMRKNA
jgi:selenocysteine lyase/cysteine desulfurase